MRKTLIAHFLTTLNGRMYRSALAFLTFRLSRLRIGGEA